MMTTGYWLSQAIHTAAKLGVADQLAREPASAEELAARLGVHGPTLHRLLRTLASAGIFAEVESARFTLTPMGQLLRSDVPGSVRPFVLWAGHATTWAAWGELEASVRTGEAAFPTVHGTDVWSYYRERPELNALFDGAMAGMPKPLIDGVLAAYDFGAFKSIVDVGGGKGQLLAAILGASPAARGTLFDQPQVIAGAAPLLAAANVADRVAVVGGDFFAEVPRGGDAYLLKMILHDWNDERAAKILATCRAAMAPGSKLVIVERVIPPGNGPHLAKHLDLMMLVFFGSKERTEPEFSALLAGAGFRLDAVRPAQFGLAVLEATPV